MKKAGRPRKLTPAQVKRAREVYELRRTLPSLPQLAREWGVADGTVYQTAMGRRYKEVR